MRKDNRVSTEAEKEIFQTANQIYDTLDKGATRKHIRRTVIKLVNSINSDLSDIEKVECGICIESLILGFLCEFLSAGIIIHIKKE